jgi:hypothetical protein
VPRCTAGSLPGCRAGFYSDPGCAPLADLKGPETKMTPDREKEILARIDVVDFLIAAVVDHDR